MLRTASRAFTLPVVAILILATGNLSGISSAVAQTDQAGIEFFEKHIRPVLVNSCYECHSSDADSVMGSLRLDDRNSLLAGGDNGPAIIPGDSQRSLLISALRHEEFEMPPEGQLSEAVIHRFAEWIQMGAPDPRAPVAHTAAGQDVQAIGSGELWSLKPLQREAPPEVMSDAWSQSEIDRFIMARLEDDGLQPVPAADRSALIRRVYFDLWGLPPDPVAIESFLEDESEDAFATLVDELLTSPRFGERWGRHWLDVARFGESTGHERNFLYPHAWRYRDYVIASFNEDKPYDRFVIEQIAGDKLTADTPQTRDEQLTATGFLAIGPRNLLGGNDDFQLDNADDQINVTMRAMLGLTVSCARCHDHKFDPISTKDYYSLASIFLSTETLYGTQPGTGGGNNRHPTELIPIGSNAEQQHAAYLQHERQVAKLTKEVGKANGALKKLTSLPDDKLAEKQGELEAAKSKCNNLDGQLASLREQAPAPPAYAMGVRDANKIIDTEVRISGEARNKGEVARRGVLDCCEISSPTIVPEDSSGRLELAQWMIHPDHPLTARVMVNRIWLHLMGRGLVPTVDNFGHNGQPPSHPALLDWLADRYQRDEWSTKSMIRRIVSSQAYQLSARHDADNYQIDPGNVTYWRRSPRRLEAESIRDSILAVSGRLDLEPPSEGSVVATIGDGCLVRQISADKLVVDSPHRSIYLPAARYFEPEILQVFDGASASLVIGDRAETNVPAQSLFLLNNQFVIAQAEAAAQRITGDENLDDAGRVELAYMLALGRSATADEMSRTLAFLQRHLNEPVVPVQDTSQDTVQDTLQDGSKDEGLAATQVVWSGVIQALFASAEFRYVY